MKSLAKAFFSRVLILVCTLPSSSASWVYCLCHITCPLFCLWIFLVSPCVCLILGLGTVPSYGIAARGALGLRQPPSPHHVIAQDTEAQGRGVPGLSEVVQSPSFIRTSTSFCT